MQRKGLFNCGGMLFPGFLPKSHWPDWCHVLLLTKKEAGKIILFFLASVTGTIGRMENSCPHRGPTALLWLCNPAVPVMHELPERRSSSSHNQDGSRVIPLHQVPAVGPQAASVILMYLCFLICRIRIMVLPQGLFKEDLELCLPYSKHPKPPEIIAVINTTVATRVRLRYQRKQ